MNEALSNQVLEIVKGTKDFVIEQAPDIVKQYLSYYFYVNLISLIVLVIVLVFVGTYSYKGFKHECTKTYGCPEAYVIIGGVISLSTLVGCICSLCNVVEITLAPKIYLLEAFKIIK